MIPVGDADGTEVDLIDAIPSIRHFCNLFGLGRQLKYVKSAISNRIAFNIYLEKDGKLEIRERASCAGSDDATIITFGDDGSITTQLYPFETVKKYKNHGCSKIVRWQPPLDEYSRDKRSDSMPINHKRLILVFFMRKLPKSPNKKDIVKL